MSDFNTKLKHFFRSKSTQAAPSANHSIKPSHAAAVAKTSTTTAVKMAGPISTDQFLAAAKHRRTVYGLKKQSTVSDNRVREIIEQVLSFAPSSYNTQPLRVVLATGDKHTALWDAIIAAAEPILKGAGAGAWEKMSGVFQMHKGAYGSVAFFDSADAIAEAGKTHASAAHMFEEFSLHSSGMAQILVWSALELEGLGANLQHLNAIPPVEVAIKKFLAVPDDWKLRAHLNYGDEAQPHPEVPNKLPINDVLKTLN